MLQALAAEHPDQRLQVWCQDEARVGQKGRTTRVWYERGMRPRGIVDQRYTSLYLFAASRPGTDEAFALALPRADAGTMGVFLQHFSHQLAPDVHAVLILDQAGWHDERALRVPRNVTLLPLPTASPQLNPMERIWLYLRERYLSSRLGRLRRCPRCNLPGLEQAPGREGTSRIAHRLPLPHSVRNSLSGYKVLHKRKPIARVCGCARHGVG